MVLQPGTSHERIGPLLRLLEQRREVQSLEPTIVHDVHD
jgi:hypothetical protein